MTPTSTTPLIEEVADGSLAFELIRLPEAVMGIGVARTLTTEVESVEMGHGPLVSKASM